MRKGAYVVLVFAAAVMFAGGCVSTGQQTKTGSRMDIVDGKTVVIKSYGWFQECEKWEAGDRVNIAFTSSEPVGFSVSCREKKSGESICILEKFSAENYEGSITAASDDIYCFMWHNENSDDITVTFDLSVEK